MFIALNVWSQGEIKRHERNLLFALYALYCMTSYFFLISSGECKTAVTQFLKTFQERQKTFSFCSLQSN